MSLNDDVQNIIDGIARAVSDVRQQMREINEDDIRNDIDALLKTSDITLRRFRNDDLSTFFSDLLNLRSLWISLNFHDDLEAREGTDRIRILRGLAGNVALNCALGCEKIRAYGLRAPVLEDTSQLHVSKADASDLLMSLSGRLARLETVLSDYATELDELTMRSAAETAITTPYLLQMQGDVSSLQAALQIGNEVDIALLDRVVSVMAETTIEFVNTLNATVSRASRQLITAASKIARNVKLVAAGARHLARRLIENASSSLERWSTRVWNYSPDTSEMRNAHYELRLFGFRLSMLEFAVLWHLSRGHEIADIATVLSVDRETIEIAGEAARLRMQELNVERAAERLARYWEMFQRSQRKEITRKDLWEFHRNEVSAESP